MKALLELQDRDFSSKYETTIICHYRVEVPTSGNKFYAKSVKKNFKKYFDDSIDSIVQNKFSVVFHCQRSSGDFVNTIEDVYMFVDEVEETVKDAMEKAKIKKYKVVVQLTTLYGGLFE